MYLPNLGQGHSIPSYLTVGLEAIQRPPHHFHGAHIPQRLVTPRPLVHVPQDPIAIDRKMRADDLPPEAIALPRRLNPLHYPKFDCIILHLRDVYLGVAVDSAAC